MGTLTRAALLFLLLSLLASGLPVAAAPAGEGPAAEAAPLADPPVLVSPIDGATTTGASDPPVGVPTLEWAPVTGATLYHVQVSASAGFATVVIEKDTYATAYTPEIAFADGEYYWRVKARIGTTWDAYANAWTFKKDWSEGATNVPQLLSPAEGAERGAFQPADFSWSEVDGAATYRLEISLDPGFGSTAYTATTLKAQHTPTLRLPNNDYFWRVIPIDNRGNAGAPSLTGSFKFKWVQSPQLLAPPHQVEQTFLPRFSWSAVEAAKQYRLEISTQPDFSNPSSLMVYVTSQTDYTPERTLANDQDYYWRVLATDARGTNSDWSEVRRFRMKWNFEARLLAPLNNAVRTSYPYFNWAPIPGAERYEIQIDESTSFASPIASEKIYNTLSYAQPRWDNVTVDGDYFWRIRGVDAQDNVTPWSDLRSFRPTCQTSPNLIYPHYYYTPDTANLPVHGDRTIAWPVFVWDTSIVCDPATGHVLWPPVDSYQLTVDDDISFSTPNLQITTKGNAVAPTANTPFGGLTSGGIYYWRVRAYRGGQQIGADSVWPLRYDPTQLPPELPFASEPMPIYPADNFEAVEVPPVLGWLPVTGSQSYRVQVARDANFNEIVDEAVAQFVNYVPWQGRTVAMPFGTYFWRVRREAPNTGPWSVTRHFNLSFDLRTGNPFDYPPPARPASILAVGTGYTPSWTYIASGESMGGPFGLGALHVMLDRTLTDTLPLNWVIAFETSAGLGDALQYGIYVDIDHADKSGATVDPLGKPITVDPLTLPEYVIYVNKTSSQTPGPMNATYFRWSGTAWLPGQTLAALGGDLWVDSTTQALQLLVPYTALGTEDPAASGSLALTVFTTSDTPGDGVHNAIPVQPGAQLNRPAFVSDMLMPLYPFDTPSSNPIIFYDMPAVRWRTPTFDSVDGYQVQVARDARFTELVETWETYETSTWSYYPLLPASFQSKNAIEDNESYYWRVRIRHERYHPYYSSFFDYGAWSPAMRIKLDSRLVGNPRLSTADPGLPAWTTPTFLWDRVDGAAGYRLQVDDDSNFSTPLIDKKVDGTSYTPTTVFADGTYYWRVTIRRSDTVFGHWTPTMSFIKSSRPPQTLAPTLDEVVNTQPSFTWTAVLTPTVTPRLAAPRYRLQISSDLNFSANLKTIDTDSASYTLKKAESLADGYWYWRVAVVQDAVSKLGAYSPAQRFYKEYRSPSLTSPTQGSSTSKSPQFEWNPLDGAAYYQIQIANNELFTATYPVPTDATHYTPTTPLKPGPVYWRVRMIDADGKLGPYELGRVRVGHTVYLPAVVR
jgi:hypothetical protein